MTACWIQIQWTRCPRIDRRRGNEKATPSVLQSRVTCTTNEKGGVMNENIDRRTFLKAASAGVLAMSATLNPQSAAAQAVPNSSGTGRPKASAPPGAADCHIHIYDARFKSDLPALAGATVAD